MTAEAAVAKENVKADGSGIGGSKGNAKAVGMPMDISP